MVYWRIIRKSFDRNLQYRLSHLINNVASSIFGLVFIAIWAGVLKGKPVIGPYDATTMAHYIAICQSVLWMTTFLSPGLNVQVAVRSGAVSLDLIKPVHYLWYVVSHELGRVAYNACYRSLPIYLLLGLAVGFYFPHHLATYLWTALSLFLGVYIGLLLFFLIGISSFWTTEIRWIHYILLSLIFGFGGQMLPLDLFPGVLGKIAPYLPFSGLIYHPVMIYLELAPPSGILVQASWAAVLTMISLVLTNMARRNSKYREGSMLGLYKKLIAASIRAQMQYKMNFITSATTTGMIMVLDFLILSAILYRFDDITGWDIYEVGILYGISSAAISLYRLFAPEIHDFERYVISGELDQLLIRPVSPLLLLLTRNLDLSRLGGVVQGLSVLTISLVGLHAQGKDMLTLLLFTPVAIVSGSVIYFSISLSTAASSFWTQQIKDLQTFTIYAPANASNYPIGLYPGWLKWLFFSFIPIAFMNYLPMLALLDKGGSWYYPILTPLVAGFALYFSHCFWRWGIQHYHSTGS